MPRLSLSTPLLTRRLLGTWLFTCLLFGLLDTWLELQYPALPGRMLLFVFFAFLLFLFLKWRLLDPLHHLARYAADLDQPHHSAPLQLLRPSTWRHKPDELDMVANAINAFRDCLLEDRHKREGTEKKLQENEEKFRRLVERIQSDHFFYSHDTQGIFTYVSPSVETILGHTPDAFFCHYSHFLTNSPANNNVFKHTEKSIQGIPQPPYHAEVLHQDGSTRILEVVEFPVWDESGEVVAVEGLARDVTQQRQFATMARDREAAILANEAKTRFLATVSHEIRTPLNGLLGMLSLLGKSPLAMEQRQLLETAAHSGKSLLSLLNDILDLAKVESGKLELESIDFDPVILTKETMATFTSQAEEKGLTLLLNTDSKLLPGYRGDPSRLRQILSNLLGNAIKFTDKGSVRLAVSILPPQDASEWVEFSVSDTGPGIPEEAQATLFEAFSRGEQALGNIPGSGLGLHISKQLVLAMGGRIGLTSTPGLGSRFFFRLPLLPGISPVTSRPTPVVSSSRPLSILLAEDNRINQEVATGMLSYLGHTCTLASDGHEALAWLEKREFDLILMDIHMPGMDGLEATRLIRKMANPAKAATPIIALTADVFSNRIDSFREAGMDATLAKPLEIDTLATMLTNLFHDPNWRKAPPSPPIDRHDKSQRILDESYLEQLIVSVGKEQLRELLKMLKDLGSKAQETFFPTKRENLASISSSAHRLAGAAANLGLSLLSVSLLELELAATEEDLQEVERHLAEFAPLFRRSVEAMEEWLVEEEDALPESP